MAAYIFDLESDGFLDEATRIHSLVLKDIDSGKVFSYVPDTIESGLKQLSKADYVVGHNCIRFDVPLIRKLHPACNIKPKKVRDTLVMARLIHPQIKVEDVLRQTPKEVFGSHSLKAWGIRLGVKKQEYTGGFEKWNPVMQEYCEQDVEVGFKLYHHLANQQYSQRALKLEHKVAFLCAAMERNGFPFDEHAAAKLYAQLSGQRELLKQSLQDLFPPWQEVDKVFIPKADNKRYGYRKGVPVTKMKTLTFNPGSRPHIAKCLASKYGWRPKPGQMTEGGKAKIDDDILATMPYPEAKPLARFFKLQKLIAYIAEGDSAWLKMVKADGRVHTAYNPMGAVTGRATHSYPNIAQVPRVKKVKGQGIIKGLDGNYGFECRSLFGVPEGWIQLGADMSGLELRCLAHYLAYWDEGAYGRELIEGDVHSRTMEIAKLPDRDTAKTTIYALLYGARDPKLGSIVGKGAAAGKAIRERLIEGLPGLGRLLSHVEKNSGKGFLNGIDGRRIMIRKKHAALNSLLQCAGAVLCKEWMTLVEEKLQAHGLKHGWDGDYVFLAWVHDEIQLAVRPGLETKVGTICVEMASQAGRNFNFNCPLTAEYHTGRSWAETH